MLHTLLGVCTTCPLPMGYPKPSSRGSIGLSLERGLLLLNITKLFMQQALERSEHNFVTELDHAPHLALGLYYMSMSNELPQVQSQGWGSIHVGLSIEPGLLLNITILFMKQALERSEYMYKFVTKLNHAPHLARGLYYMSIPQAQSQGAV